MVGQGKSIATITTVNALNAIVGAINIFLIASFFGVDRNIEIFLAASAVLLTIQQLTASGLLSEIFLPKYLNLKSRYGKSQALDVFSSVLCWSAVISTLLCLGAYAISDWLIAIRIPGFSAMDKQAGADLLELLVPIVGIRILLAPCRAVLNAENKFGGPEVAALVGRVGNTACILFSTDYGIMALVAGLWVGALIQLFITFGLLKQIGWQFRAILQVKQPTGLNLASNISAALLSITGEEILKISRDAAISFLPQGSFAIFNYSLQIFERAGGLILKPIATVFFTSFSSAVTSGSSTLKALVTKAIDRSFGICCLAQLAAIFLLPTLLKLVLPLEKFSANDIAVLHGFLIVQFGILWMWGTMLIYRKMIAAAHLLPRLLVIKFVLNLVSAHVIWLLIREYELNGAISSFIIIHTVALFSCVYVLVRYKREFFVAPILKNVLSWGFIFISAYAFLNFFESQLFLDATSAGGSILQLSIKALLIATLVPVLGLALKNEDCISIFKQLSVRFLNQRDR